MNFKRTLKLLAVVILLGAIPAIATAQTRKAVTPKRATSKTATPAKVATSLPDGFSIKTLIGLHPEWESYVTRDDAGSQLLKLGFKQIGTGRTKITLGTDDNAPTQRARKVTYGFEGIKVTLIPNQYVQKIVFPNSDTLNQFIDTAISSGIYKKSDWDSARYDCETGLGAFTVNGLQIVFDWEP